MAADADADADADEDVLLLVHQLHLDMDGGHGIRPAHLLPPLHTGVGPPPSSPFRPPPPPQAAASAEPRLSFRGWLGAPRHWDLWVAKLRPIHSRLWRRLGIHDAVLASTYRFRRDASAILHLASFWCPRTNTFAFPWGEATVTLHDIALLAGFPAHGAPVPAPLRPEWRPDEAALNGVRLGFNRSACKKAHHSAWVKHFLTDHTDASLEHEHAAFLALWLTRFVLPGHPESTMRQALFPIAVRLARGERLALGPAVLASLYRDLCDIKALLVAAGAAATTGNADMLSSSLSLYAPLYIIQLWMWERFPMLRPERDNPPMDGEPMAACWHDLSRKINPMLIREALSSADNFVWQPYPSSMPRTSWVHSSDLTENDDLRSLSYCLRPCELVGMDCIEQYLPHRVARQFGLDQDVPGDVPRANQNWAVAWQTYELEGKNVAFFIPQTEPGVTARYAHWWRQQLPHSDLHAGAPSIPVEWKTSKRKVKKTPAAMEAEAEKERRLKKARVLPVTSDKKRKLEELYDSNLSNWLTASRNDISDTAGGSCQRGSSLPKYDTALDEALLPNVGTTNDDVVLLLPRKQTSPAVMPMKDPAVMPMMDSSINLAMGDRGGTFIAGKPPDIPNEPEGVTNTMLQEEKLFISADTSSPDATGSPEGATMVIELKEASGASDTPEEVTAPVTEEKEENFAIEGTSDNPEEVTGPVTEEKEQNFAIEGTSDNPEEVTGPVTEEKEEIFSIEGTSCFTGMNSSEKNVAVVMEADEGNAFLEEVGRAADEAIEVAPQSQQEVDVSAMNHSHVAAALHEELLPIQHTNNGCGCSKVSVSCTMEGSNVVGGLGTDDGETTCHDFIVEEQREVPSVEVIGGGDDHQIVEKDDEEKPHEDPQMEIVESAQDTALMGAGNEGEHKTDPPTVEEVATSDSMAAALLGVPEADNAEVMKDINLAKKYTEDMPMQVAEGEEAGLEQTNTSTKGTAEEEHKEFSEVDHADMEDIKTYSHFDMEKPGEAAEVEPAEIDGTKRAENAEVISDLNLAKGDTEDMPMEVAGEEAEHEQDNTSAKGGGKEEHKEFYEVDPTDMAESKTHSHFDIAKLEEAAEVQCAEINGAKRLTGRDTDGKFEYVPEVGNTEVENFRDLVVDVSDGKLEEVSQEHAEVEDVETLMEEDSNKSGDVPELEHTGLCGPVEEHIDGRSKEVHDAEVEQANGHEMDSDRPEGILQVDLQTRDEARSLEKEEIVDNTTKVPQVKHEKLIDETLTEEDTTRNSSAVDEGLAEKDGDESKEGYKVKLTEEEGHKVLMEKEEENINDAPEVELAAEGQNKAFTENNIDDHVKEVTLVAQVDGQDERLKRIGTEEIPEEMTQAHEKKFDMDMVEDSKNLTNGEMPCISATVQLKGDQMEVSHEGMMEEQHICNVELINQMEPSSDAAAMKVEGDHKTLDTHEEVARKQKQDHKIICENREATVLEGTHILDSGVKSDLVTLEVDETRAAGGIQNQKILDVDKHLAMEERQDLGTTVENNKINMLKDADTIVCDVHQIDPICTKVNEIKSTKGIQNQGFVDNEEQLAMEERQDLRTTVENNKMNLLDVADILVCSAYQIGPTGTEVNEVDSTNRIQIQEPFDDKEQLAMEEIQALGTTTEINDIHISEDGGILACGGSQIEPTDTAIDEVESTKGIQNQELLDNKELMEKGIKCITDGSGISFEEAYNASAGGANTVAVSVDVSDSSQNKSCSMEETREDKQHHGVEHENEMTILEANMIDSGELKSDATVVEVNVAGSKEGTLNQCAIGEEKEVVVQEKQDQEMEDENTEKDLADTDVLECGAKLDGAVKMFHETLLTAQATNIAGFEIFSENMQKEAPFENQNITEVECSGSSLTAIKKPEGALPPEPENQVEMKQEDLETGTEMPICKENDGESDKDHTSAEVTPSNVEEQGENDNRWAEESTKGYDKLASNPVKAACYNPIKFSKSSIEEVKRTYNTRSMYLKDIKDSLGRIRAEPLNRVQTTSAGNYSRHAVQEPISVCREIKVPLRDSARDLGRDCALELVVTSPPEENSRWRQEQYALQILEDVQNSRIAEKTRMEMEIRVLKSQIASMERQVMNLDHFTEVKSRSKRH